MNQDVIENRRIPRAKPDILESAEERSIFTGTRMGTGISRLLLESGVLRFREFRNRAMIQQYG